MCVYFYEKEAQAEGIHALLLYKGACVCACVCVVFVASAVVELVINVCIIFLGAKIFKKYGAAQSAKV